MVIAVPVERFVGLVNDLKIRAIEPIANPVAISVVVVPAGVWSEVLAANCR